MHASAPTFNGELWPQIAASSHDVAYHKGTDSRVLSPWFSAGISNLTVWQGTPLRGPSGLKVDFLFYFIFRMFNLLGIRV